MPSYLLQAAAAGAPAVVVPLRAPMVDAVAALNFAVRRFEAELSEYESEVVGAQGIDPLGWWAASSTRLASVKVFASKYLPISATSVHSESTFSGAGFTISDLRNKLTPHNSEILTCIRSNRAVCDSIDPSTRRRRHLLRGTSCCFRLEKFHSG